MSEHELDHRRTRAELDEVPVVECGAHLLQLLDGLLVSASHERNGRERAPGGRFGLRGTEPHLRCEAEHLVGVGLRLHESPGECLSLRECGEGLRPGAGDLQVVGQVERLGGVRDAKEQAPGTTVQVGPVTEGVDQEPVATRGPAERDPRFEQPGGLVVALDPGEQVPELDQRRRVCVIGRQ